MIASPLIVLDIGCRWGFADVFLDSGCKTDFIAYGFDPDSAECDRLNLEYRSNNVHNVHCEPIALAGKAGTRTLYITAEPACSSLHKPIELLARRYPSLACIQLQKTEEITVSTLALWAHSRHIDSIDYLKIDTQGSELEILQGGFDLIKTIRCIDIEMEFNALYENQSLFAETDCYLRQQGFVLWRLNNMVHYSLNGTQKNAAVGTSLSYDLHSRMTLHPHGGQLFWVDARYVHNDVLNNFGLRTDVEIARDLLLFNALNQLDVVDHILINQEQSALHRAT